MLFLLIKASLLGNRYLLWSPPESQETNTSSPPKMEMGAIPCPFVLLGIPISQIRNPGCQASLPAGILNFYKRGSWSLPRFWPQPLTWLWGVESTHHFPPSPRKSFSPWTHSPAQADVLSPPHFPSSYTFSVRVGWMCGGGIRNVKYGCLGAGTSGVSLSKATLRCEEKLVSLFRFTTFLFPTGTLHIDFNATRKVLSTSCYFCYKNDCLSFTFTPLSRPGICLVL